MRQKRVVPMSANEAKSPKSLNSFELVKSNPKKAPMVVKLPMVRGDASSPITCSMDLAWLACEST